jgi:hypothetical protein
MLGTTQNPGWLDLSEFVVHFTKGGPGSSPYNTIMSILYQRVLRRGPAPFGAARKVGGLEESQRAVCFSEVPLGYLSRIAERRQSKYGIGLRKRFVLDHGGAPIWYLEQGTPPADAFSAMVNNAAKIANPNDPIWKLTPLVDYPSGPESPYQYDFRWEREWRIADDLHFDHETDVEFLLIPEDLHASARSFFKDAYLDNSGPAYFCAFIDPSWNADQVKAALAAGGPSAPAKQG